MARSKPKGQAKMDPKVTQDSPPTTEIKGEGSEQGGLSSKNLKAIALATLILVLAAVSSTVSQFFLSPVYGSVPSGIYHRRGFMMAALCGWMGKNRLNSIFSTKLRYVIPVLAFCIPAIQRLLFQQSNKLGPIRGPLVTEALTFYPLVTLSTYTAASLLQDISFPRLNRIIKDQATFLASYVILSGAEEWSATAIPRYIGSNIVFTRLGLQTAIAAIYALLLPSKWVLLGLLSFPYHAYLHQTLNSTLQEADIILIDRQESLTGYISILESTTDRFRVMRCDHSLLGGEWALGSENSEFRLAEPIYAVFAMLEAVRLVLNDDGSSWKPDADKNALVM